MTHQASLKIQVVGVVGAGVMGIGIAQTLAHSRFDVILIDLSEDILRSAEVEIKNLIRLQRLFGKGGETSQLLGRISLTTDLSRLASVGFVIETVTETPEAKQSVYEAIDLICPPDTIFASNTSAIPIKRIASLTARANKVIGIHFMNPVTLTTAVEVIRGEQTSEETLAVTKSLLERMGKQYVVVNDSAGFVSNRVLMLMINEAISVVEEGIATPEDIDKLFKTCFSHKMGPLETADLIGLDTILMTIDVLRQHFGEGKYKSAALLKQMVDRGELGRKTGKGFYEY
jgi:3-hydroxybutyryl-CoA dehydrogenase